MCVYVFVGTKFSPIDQHKNAIAKAAPSAKRKGSIPRAFDTCGAEFCWWAGNALHEHFNIDIGFKWLSENALHEHFSIDIGFKWLSENALHEHYSIDIGFKWLSENALHEHVT